MAAPNTSAAYSVFAHLNAEKAPLYRAILTHFVTERARLELTRLLLSPCAGGASR